MAAGEYLTGAALLAFVVGAVSYAAIALVRARLPSYAGPERWLAIALLATALLIAIHLVPAMLGILDRWVVAALAAAVLAISLAAAPSPAPRRAEATAGVEAAADAGIVSRVAAIAIVGAVTVYALAVLARLHDSPPTFIDTVTFHVPGAVRWIQSGSIWQIDQFLPGQAQGYYPGNGNVVQLAAMLPWDSDFLIRLVNLPFYALTGLAVCAAGRELGAPLTSAAVAAGAAISVPAVTSYVVDSPTPDAVMYATFATGIFFLLRHARMGARADLVLAAIGLGIALGSRWYGVSSVAVIVIVWLAAQTVARRWTRALVLDAALMLATIAAAGGIWLIRNWVESGNPVFPVEVSVFGVTLFDAPRDVIRELAGFSIAHYFDDWDVLSGFVFPAIKLQIGYVGVAFAAATIAAIALTVRGGGDGSPGRVLALALAALGLVVTYTVTPYTALGLEGRPYELGANVRYLIPALIAAAPVLAWVLGRCGRARPLLEALVVAVAIDAMLRGVVVSVPNLLAGLVAAAALAAGAYAISVIVRRDRIAGLAATVAGALLVAGALYSAQRQLLDDRYIGYAPALDVALTRAPADADIGVAGAWPVTTISPILPLLGPRFDNDVSYVGERRDGMLLPFDDRDSFAAALERGDFDLVIIGKEKPLAFPQRPEEDWAVDAGYREIAEDENFAVLAPAGAGEAS